MFSALGIMDTRKSKDVPGYSPQRRGRGKVLRIDEYADQQSVYGRGAGAGPGARISGSPLRTWPRVTKNTAAVHAGKRSSPGTSSAATVGRKAQCQPRILVMMAAVTRSSAVSNGETPPAKKSGKPTIWMASAMMATNQALRCSRERTVLRNSNIAVSPKG